MPKAREEAEKAIRLDPNSGEAHTSLGIVKLDYEWDRAAGQAEFRRALELNPGSSWAHHWFAHSLETQGKLVEALKQMRAALALDPLSIPIRWDIAGELMSARRYHEVLTDVRQSLELFPNHPVLRVMEGRALYQLGDHTAADRMFSSLTQDASQLPNGPDQIALLAFIAAQEGRKQEARAGLESLERLRLNWYVEPMQVTQICLALHDRECLVKWFRRAVELRSAETVYVPMHPEIDKHDPEIKALMAQIH
jgi:tetratricopeptide (TPR) repeat protein